MLFRGYACGYRKTESIVQVQSIWVNVDRPGRLACIIQADLLLRVTNQYVEKRHAEHWKKAGYIGLWNSTIGGILYAAWGNLGQLGVLVPYIVHAERCMWETFFHFTQGAAAMRKVFVRLGAPIFYQLWLISVPLIKRGSHAFNDSKLKKQITAILVTINATVIRHTPYIVDRIGAFGGWLFRCGQKPALAVSAGDDGENQEGVSSSAAAPDLASGTVEDEDALEVEIFATAETFELVWDIFEEGNFRYMLAMVSGANSIHAFAMQTIGDDACDIPLASRRSDGRMLVSAYRHPRIRLRRRLLWCLVTFLQERARTRRVHFCSVIRGSRWQG